MRQRHNGRHTLFDRDCIRLSLIEQIPEHFAKNKCPIDGIFRCLKNDVPRLEIRFGLFPAGIEKSFILAGNEFEGGRTPLEATLSWTINWDHDFIGKDAILKQKEKGDYQRLTNLICLEKGIPRNKCLIQKGKKEVGVVTSGTLSPCLNTGIAMGYVHPEYRDKDSELEIIIRGKPVKAKVVKPPIVPKDWAKQN